MGGPENGNFPLLYVVNCPYVGGRVVQKSLKAPLRNIKMAPYSFGYAKRNYAKLIFGEAPRTLVIV